MPSTSSRSAGAARRPMGAVAGPGARRLPTPGGRSYWALSRAPRYSLLFALPLLVLYEGLALALGAVDGVAVRNGADVWLKTPFLLLLGPHGPLAFGALVVLGGLALVVRDWRRQRAPLRRAVFAGMLAESAAMAVVCGLLIGVATARLLDALPLDALPFGIAAPAAVAPDAPPPLAVAAQDLAAEAAADAGAERGEGLEALPVREQLMIALGAGLYEELLFRVVLVSGLVLAARRLLGWGAGAASLFATVGGALLFALAHHVGPYGEPLAADAFTFRTLAGLFFSGLYVLRGFGITAWTHALYDVLVLAA